VKGEDRAQTLVGFILASREDAGRIPRITSPNEYLHPEESVVSREYFDYELLESFWRFICERQQIWHKRFVERQLPPWTKDEILKTTRFTNVYRELDPGTQFALREILETTLPIQDKIFNVMLYRLIGRTETFSAIGLQHVSSFDPSFLEKTLRFIRDVEGKPPFSGAYIVSTYLRMGSRDKVVNIARLFDALAKIFHRVYDSILACRSAKDVFHELRRVYGFGTFLAYQVLVDLLYPLKINEGRPILPFTHNDWAIAGPGAKRGIEVLLSSHVGANELRVMRWLHEHQQTEFERLRLAFPYLRDQYGDPVPISLSNIENCLCEFYKYIKIRSGTGRARRRFVARDPNEPVNSLPTQSNLDRIHK
jgi:hypothetical protein